MGDCKVKVRWEKDKLGEFCIGEGVCNNGQVIKSFTHMGDLLAWIKGENKKQDTIRRYKITEINLT